MEQDSTKIRLALVKNNRVSKYTLSVKSYAIHNINIKARVKNSRQIRNFPNIKDKAN